ncbi:MAG TPA: class I SAM-dependent methyltransferase [Solirubrobacteraceae bacterium]|jgi:SAM-dependent methyltransferase
MNMGYVPLRGTLIGERTIPGSVPGWGMSVHAARYLWAMPRVDGHRVADLGCGTGYGSYLLSWSGATAVVGVDVSPEAIAYGQEHYAGVDYRVGDLTDPVTLPDADVAVCFEVLEHIAFPERVLASALSRYERLLLSMPNPLLGGSHLNPHHVQDWPLRKLKQQLRNAGAGHIHSYHQMHRNFAVIRGGPPWASSWVLEARR